MLPCAHRIYTNSKQDTNQLQYSTVAFTAGAAVVSVLRWLAELRDSDRGRREGGGGGRGGEKREEEEGGGV